MRDTCHFLVCFLFSRHQGILQHPISQHILPHYYIWIVELEQDKMLYLEMPYQMQQTKYFLYYISAQKPLSWSRFPMCQALYKHKALRWSCPQRVYSLSKEVPSQLETLSSDKRTHSSEFLIHFHSMAWGAAAELSFPKGSISHIHVYSRQQAAPAPSEVTLVQLSQHFFPMVLLWLSVCRPVPWCSARQWVELVYKSWPVSAHYCLQPY